LTPLGSSKTFGYLMVVERFDTKMVLMNWLIKIIYRVLLPVALGFIVSLMFGSTAANAHGGGLDSSGGHNCYVGSCAGTYHYHRYSGGGSSSTATPPKSVTRVKPVCLKSLYKNISKSNVA
jgi:hypothetical protein